VIGKDEKWGKISLKSNMTCLRCLGFRPVQKVDKDDGSSRENSKWQEFIKVILCDNEQFNIWTSKKTRN